ncbi:MAG: response regulator [Elainellaceae cyanobacterium]
MAINSEIRDQAYLFFVEEVPELLQTIESGLLTLRQDRSTARVHSLMRAAHSLKGGAAGIGLQAIATLAHRLETIFRACYSDSFEIDAELEEQLLQAFDCLRLPLTEQIETGMFDAQRTLAIAEPIFSAIEARCGDALNQAESYVPSSADLGIDMVKSILEVDVDQGLKRLQTVIAHPQDYEVAGELRAQAEVLAGFGEILNLPCFEEIAAIARQALDRHPDRALEITQLAVIDFEAARQSILAGNRVPLNPVAPELASLADPLTHHSDVDDGSAQLETDEPFDALLERLEAELSLNNHFEQAAAVTGDRAPRKGSDECFDSDSFDSDSFDSDSFDRDGFDSEHSADVDDERFYRQDIDDESADTDFDANYLDLESLSFEDFGDQDLEPDAIEALFGPDQPDFEHDSALDLDPLDSLDPEDPAPFLLLLDDSAEPQLSDHGQLAGDRPPTETAESAPDGQPTLEATVQPAEQLADDLPPTQASQPLQPPSPPSPDTDKGGSLVLSPRPVHQLSVAQPQRLPTRPALVRSRPSLRQDGAASPHLTTRVDSERLERINNLVGELSINRDSLSLQNEQLRGVLRELLNRFGRFQEMAGHLQDLADQAMVKSEQHDATVWTHAPRVQQRQQIFAQMPVSQGRAMTRLETGDYTARDFDPLEMDRYGTIHSQLQEILEDIVQLEEAVDDVTLFAQQSDQALEKQRHTLTRLRDELIWARMLPLGEILNRFPRLLRDLAATHGKPVELKLTGTGVLVDKAILEKLYDPLLHLLRNAFDHGIEPQSVRRRLSKPQQGQIEIRAYHKGNQTVIEVKDDGQGLNLDLIRSRALELGWVTAAELAGMMPEDLFEFIFEPGFSTARRVSELSGRGIGLDVVQAQLKAIKGAIAVASSPGQGTTFTLYLPLTLTIVKLIICLVGNVPVALPADSIEEVLTPQVDQLKQAGGQRFFPWQKRMIPVYRLTDLLEYSCLLPDTLPSKALTPSPYPKDWSPPLLVLRQEDQICALEVDRLVNEQELVIKPFGTILKAPSYTYGCTILGDGNLIPVIDGLALLELNLERASQPHAAKPQPLTYGDRLPNYPPISVPPIAQAPTILVVDDAIALRRTLALSLEKSGFRVVQARDGQEAIDRLQQSTLPINLVVCDIEMPNMNGFEFLSYRRQDALLAEIPVVMLTSRSNDKHRWLAVQLGANAYFTKPYLEQEFLSTLREILTQEVRNPRDAEVPHSNLSP